MHKLFRNTVVVLGGLIGLATPALAGYTTVNPPTGEETHAEIFSFIYGGKFVASGYDFTNGSITARRVDDYASTSTPTALPPQALVGDLGTTDQFFNANYIYAQVDAKFAVNSQNFGYMSGNSGYTKVFDQTGWGYNVGETFTSDLSRASGQTIRFARNGNDNMLVSSNPAENVDQRDHMVTYEIVNNKVITQAATSARTWMFFFEDAPFGSRVADFDFNDLVVEVSAVAVAVPEPTSLAVLPLAAFALRRRRA